MLFKLIYKDKSPEVKRTVELEGTYTLDEAREKRAWLKETYNWYSPDVRVLIERVE
tara:strand:- start:176 stop:343 length:168 start_codon:yes stop_codon:yes gene_type:complete